MRCVSGIPQCAAGTIDPAGSPQACSTPASDPSAGYHVLALDSNSDGSSLKTCSLSGAYKPALFSTCSMTQSATLLSVFVDYDCSVQISPISDPACAEPGATGYTYTNLTINAAYASLTSIRTVMPSVDASGVNSFLLSLTQGNSDGQLSLTYWAASTNPASAGSVPATTCSATLDVTGGQVAKEPASPISGSSCPAGSYAVTGQLCAPW